MKKQIELLDFNVKEKDLYVETMKLINNEIDEKQFIKDHLYYEMVKSIYIHNFKEFEDNDVLYANEEYTAQKNYSLINIYLNSAIDTYHKIKDLNKYMGYNFKPFDESLIFYISGQYIRYFNDRNIFLNENIYTFTKKIVEVIGEYKHHPFRRIRSDIYNVEELDGINIYINDLIHNSQKTNKDLINNLGIKREELLKIRQGQIKYTKDILYMIFLGLQLSEFEIREFINSKLSKYDLFKNSFTERDMAILKIINDINIYKISNNGNVLEILNNLLIEKGFSKLNTNIILKKGNKDEKTILLIGGFGFIGRECIEYFSLKNYKVCVLSKSIPNKLPENVICYQGDVTNRLIYERILSENKIDYIIHLAAISTIKDCEEMFCDTLLINEQAPNLLYSTILENKIPIKCVIFPSTVQLYQGLDNENCDELTFIDPTKVCNDYAFSKYQAEQLSLKYAEKNIPIIIARLSNIYGRGDNNQRLIPEILKSIKDNKNINLYVDETNKSAKINLLYVNDLIKAFDKIFEVMDVKPILYDSNYPQNIIVNIASDESYYVFDIAQKMYELASKEFKPLLNKTDIKSTKNISIKKLKEVFNFKQSYDLEKGLGEIMEEYESQKKKELRRDY